MRHGNSSFTSTTSTSTSSSPSASPLLPIPRQSRAAVGVGDDVTLPNDVAQMKAAFAEASLPWESTRSELAGATASVLEVTEKGTAVVRLSLNVEVPLPALRKKTQTRRNEEGTSSNTTTPTTPSLKLSFGRKEGRDRDRQRQRETVVRVDGQTLIATPWFPSGCESCSLTAEVNALFELMSLTSQEKADRTMLRSTLQQILTKWWDGVQIRTAGGFLFPCALPDPEEGGTCPRIIVEGCGALTSEVIEEIVEALQGELNVVTYHVSTVSDDQAFARVKYGCQTADVTFLRISDPNNSKHERLREALHICPASKVVFTAVWLVLHQSRCNTPSTGGLSALCVLVMVLHACNRSANPNDPGQLLVDFFTIFGASAVDYPITVDGIISGKCAPLVVVDPADPSVNLAESCTRAPQIFSIFRHCSETLAKWSGAFFAGYRGRTPLSSILAYDSLWPRVDVVSAHSRDTSTTMP